MLKGLRDWANTHIADVSDKTEKTRKLVMFLGVVALLIDSDVAVTLGSASMGGLGVSISPPQVLPVAEIIVFILLFKIVALWVTIAIESGRDKRTARNKAFRIVEPDLMGSDENTDDIELAVRTQAYAITSKWTLWKLVWEVAMPSLIGLAGVATFLYKAFL